MSASKSAVQCAALALLSMLSAGAAAQAAEVGFDFIGSDSSLSDGNYSVDCATYAPPGPFGDLSQVAMLYWQPTERMRPRELWAVVVADRQSVANQVQSVRVSVWDSSASMIASPSAGNLLDQVVPTPDYGSFAAPFGSAPRFGGTGNRPTYRIGVDLRSSDLVFEPGTYYLIGINVESGLPLDTVWNGFAVQFSDVVGPWSYSWTSTQPGVLATRRFGPERTLALHLVGSDAVLPLGDGCGPVGGVAPRFDSTDPDLGGAVRFDLRDMPSQAAGALVVSFGAPAPVTLGPCTYFPDLATQFTWTTLLANAQGLWTMTTPLPALPSAEGLGLTAQGIVVDAGAPFGASLTNGLQLTFRSNHR